MKLGAHLQDEICSFLVWAPFSNEVEVKIVFPEEVTVPLEKDDRGYWSGMLERASSGMRYIFRLDGGKERPDPASRFQPLGVHGPSQIVDPDEFAWQDNGWTGVVLDDYVIYELHVGAFTREGTFESVVPHLDYLRDLGITALELMPVAQFPGTRNWGYDGVYPFAVQNSYGGPTGLKKLVNACHERGLAVILDVVYNHLGPEGNYLWDFGPYFTDKYKTPWGDAINFDGPHSDEVRRYFIENALSWITDFHIDALRIDAIDGIFDFSAKHFLEELGDAVHARAGELGRRVYVIAESDLNDVRVINPKERGGYGLDAQWNDDFHHALHTLITEERGGYYEDFGDISHLEKAYREGFVYSGEYSVFRKRRHGSSSRHLSARHFVIFSQNHDQVGNRMRGERLSSLASFEALKLAAAAVLLSPNIPLLFMGEEYGEDAPFMYFVSHSDYDLIEAVRKGRKEEFRAFSWGGEHPDPQSEETFLASRIDPAKGKGGRYNALLRYYGMLLTLRRTIPALKEPDRDRLEVSVIPDTGVITLHRWDRTRTSRVYCLFNFKKNSVEAFLAAEGTWKRVLDSADSSWNGPGSLFPEQLREQGRGTVRAQSVVVFVKEEDR
ncbi:MAG TPA: malto-oligosyltrehalose trehalohydrolase [Nitrospirota bacterium]|nr:malto-oligosyltrehalose trehalohydrolase [Nitrospirota bacterium]